MRTSNEWKRFAPKEIVRLRTAHNCISLWGEHTRSEDSMRNHSVITPGEMRSIELACSTIRTCGRTTWCAAKPCSAKISSALAAAADVKAANQFFWLARYGRARLWLNKSLPAIHK